MKLYSKNLALGLLGLMVITACDDINEVDRITVGKVEEHKMEAETKTVEVEGKTFVYTDQHNILIEDFTGWRCVNCPNMAAFLANNIEIIYPSVVIKSLTMVRYFKVVTRQPSITHCDRLLTSNTIHIS